MGIQKIGVGFAIIAGSMIIGCQSLRTQKNQFVEVDKKVAERDFASAAMTLDAAKDTYYEKKDRVLFYLDAGILYHYNGSHEKSNEFMTRAEESIDELYTMSVSRYAATLLLNDNVMDYSGEAYEDVYLNIFKALNYLKVNRRDDAFVEIRRINNKLATLEDRYRKIADAYNTSNDAQNKFTVSKSQFNNSALGRYLSALMYRVEGKADDARLDLQKIDEAWQSQPQLYNFPEPSFNGFLKHSEKVKCSILSFIGKSPQLFARTLTIHTFKDAVAIYASDDMTGERLDFIPWHDMTDGYHFKFSLPYMQKMGTKVVRVSVRVDAQQAFELQTIESMENTAEDTYRLKEKIVYFKTIIRAIAKGIMNEKSNRELDKSTGGDWLGGLTRALTSAVIDETEHADLRLSRYFPAKALIGELELDPGTHTFAVNYYDERNRLMFVDTMTAVVSAIDVNLLQSTYLN